MRPNAIPSLRHLRRASSRLLVSDSAFIRISLPATSTRCASTTPAPKAEPLIPRTPKGPSLYGADAATKRSPPPPTRRPGGDPSTQRNAMSVDQVDTSLPPLPTVPTSTTAAPDRQSTDFVRAVQMTSPAVGNGSLANGNDNDTSIDWSSSFHGLSTVAFEPHIASVLMAPINPDDVEVKPDGICYYPEIKYRRILNQAFGPGGWGLAPRGELVVGEKVVTREYALVVHGRFVAQARGECQYFSEDTIPTAAEGCKSNALSRCCKDLGIASELWDPRFIRAFKKDHCREIWVEHVVTKKKRQIWTRKDVEPQYPYAAVKK